MLALPVTEQCFTRMGLFKDLSHDAFNQLKSIHDNYMIPLDDIVKEMANDLLESGLNEHIGISRTHNHYQLNSGELIQLSLGSSINDPTVPIDNVPTVAHLTPVTITSVSVMPIPYMWAYDKTDKKFFPIQFFDGTNTRMQQRLIELCGKKRNDFIDFLHKFIKYVEQTGTEDDLGFYLRYEDLMSLDKENGQGLLENTNTYMRRQTMIPTTQEVLQKIINEKQKTHPDFKLTTTHWFFNDDYTHQSNKCTHYCNHVCDHTS